MRNLPMQNFCNKAKNGQVNQIRYCSNSLYDPSIKHITWIRNPGLLEEATDSLSMTSHPKKSCYCKWKRIFIRWCYYGSCFKSNDTSDYEKLDISTHIIGDCKKQMLLWCV